MLRNISVLRTVRGYAAMEPHSIPHLFHGEISGSSTRYSQEDPESHFPERLSLFDAVMKCKENASRKSADDSRLLDGTSKTKRDNNAKEKRTKSPKQSTVSKHSFASRWFIKSSVPGLRIIVDWIRFLHESNNRCPNKFLKSMCINVCYEIEKFFFI